MKYPAPSFLLVSTLTLLIGCGGDTSSNSGDGDAAGDGDTGDGDAGDGDSGDGDSGDGDAGDGDSGDGDSGDGDGDASGTGGITGDGDAGGGGGSAATGTCFDQSCAGDCAPADEGAPDCGGDWVCRATLVCTEDLASYCGCDGETFQGSSSCAPFAYAHRGPCEEGIAGGLNCDGSQVVTDGPEPECDPGQLPQVVGGTWGDCVPLNECGCESPGSQDQCGDGLSYVCRNSNRCGDLVN